MFPTGDPKDPGQKSVKVQVLGGEPSQADPLDVLGILSSFIRWFCESSLSVFNGLEQFYPPEKILNSDFPVSLIILKSLVHVMTHNTGEEGSPVKTETYLKPSLNSKMPWIVYENIFTV